MPLARSRAPLSPRVGDELETGAVELGSGVRLHDRAIADVAAAGLEARGLDIRASALTGCDLSGARLSFSMLQDTALERCTLAGVVSQDGGLRRVRFTDCRLTGMAWPECDIE